MVQLYQKHISSAPLLIEPQLTDVGIMEFHRAEELCAKGEETIARLAEQIRYQLLT